MESRLMIIEDTVHKAYCDIKKEGKRPTLRGLLRKSLWRLGYSKEQIDILVAQCGYTTDLGKTYVQAIIDRIQLQEKYYKDK